MQGARESRSRARVYPTSRQGAVSAAPSVTSTAHGAPLSQAAHKHVARVALSRAFVMVGVFAAAALLDAAGAAAIGLVACAAFCFAALADLLSMDHGLSPVHFLRVAYRSLSVPAAAAALPSVFRVVFLLVALSIVGPTRVLVASGAVAPVIVDLGVSMSKASSLDRRRAVRSVLIVFLSLWLVAYDATGGRFPAERARLVSHHVMKTRAGHAVQEKLHSFANRVRPGLGRARLLYSRSWSHSRLPASEVLQPPPRSPPLSPGSAVTSGSRVGKGQQESVVSQSEQFGKLADAGDAVSRTGSVIGAGSESSRSARIGEKLSTLQQMMGSQAASAGEGIGSNVKQRRRLLAMLRDGISGDREDPGDQSEADVSNDDPSGNHPAQKRESSADEEARGLEGIASAKMKDSEFDSLPTVSLASGFAGVSLSVLSFLGAAWEAEALEVLAGEVGSRTLAHTHSMLCAAFAFLPVSLATGLLGSFFGEDVSPSSVLTVNLPLFGLCFLGIPQFLNAESLTGNRYVPIFVPQTKPPSRTGGTSTIFGTDPASAYKALGRNAFTQFATVIILFPAIRGFAATMGLLVVPFSFSLWLAVIGLGLLLHANLRQIERDRSRQLARSGMTGGGGAGPLLSLGPGSRGSLSYIPRFRQNLGAALSRFGTFVAESRSHKASWQVFNFLVMQSGMVVVETTYAFMTDSVGLISISADNLFCCIALGAGLFAIQSTASARRPSLYSFGLARLESLCGFVNGVLLIVVAVLLMLEALDRVLNPEFIDTAHIFAVCLFGIVGNGLGLVFFPPESRRENHNVQSIYLHIWANTLAYVGISASAIILGVNPDWSLTELGVASVVAALVVASAIPLLVRSSRLLMNYPAAEKMSDIRAIRGRLSHIEGVVQVANFRVWNLTPTSMVVTVHLLVSPSSSVHERDVLQCARNLCAELGAPTNQTTIQITRGDKTATSPHVRSRSLGSYDIEGVCALLQSGASSRVADDENK